MERLYFEVFVLILFRWIHFRSRCMKAMIMTARLGSDGSPNPKQDDAKWCLTIVIQQPPFAAINLQKTM